MTLKWVHTAQKAAMEGYLVTVFTLDTTRPIHPEDTVENAYVAHVFPMRCNPDVGVDEQVKCLLGTQEDRIADLVMCDNVQEAYSMFLSEYEGSEALDQPMLGSVFPAYHIANHRQLRKFLRYASVFDPEEETIDDKCDRLYSEGYKAGRESSEE